MSDNSKFPFSKSDFTGFIQKYYLNGKVESAVIESKDNNINTIFRNSLGDLRGQIKLDNFNMQDFEIGFYRTGVLLSILGILENDINIKLIYDDSNENVTNINMNDAKGKKVSYATSEIDIVEHDGKKGVIKDYDVVIKLNNEIISDILKANSAIDKNNGITFLKKKDKCFIVFGYSQSNSDRIEFELETEKLNDEFDEMSFPSEYLKEILSVNGDKFEDAVMEISLNGVMRLYFKNSSNLSSEYWVVKLN